MGSRFDEPFWPAQGAEPAEALKALSLSKCRRMLEMA
jgi:hypothetical protein